MTPNDEKELAEAIGSATKPLRIMGGNTRDIGAPIEGEVLSTAGLSGITLYEPGALTLVAKAGTPLAEIDAALAAEDQRLAFEPIDHRVLLGTKGVPTIGGVVATNASGPRRIAVGACRDHMLGVRFVDGTGKILKNGGRVMKNVTGYDLVKLLTGSFGTLGVLSEVSLKVLPKPETTATLIIHSLALQTGISVMSAALGSPYEVSGAAMVGNAVFLRLEGFEASVNYRFKRLKDTLGHHGEISRQDGTVSEKTWREIADVRVFSAHDAVTRVSINPSQAADLAECLWQTLGADLALDWGGGLMWFGMNASHAEGAAYQFSEQEPYTPENAYGLIHSVLQHALSPEVLAHANGFASGHATLIKAPMATRETVKVFQPERPEIAAISAGLRAKFDPHGILNAGLMQ